MFSTRNYYPMSTFDNNDDDLYHSSFSTSRPSYLADEELQLRRRLAEIQSQRELTYFDSRDTFDQPHHHQYRGFDRRYQHSSDRLAFLRRELAEEELKVERQRRLELEREELRKREIMEAGRLLLLRKEEEARLEQIRRRREQEEERLLELRLAERQAESRRLAARSQQSCPVRLALNPSKDKPTNTNVSAIDFQTLLNQFLGAQDVVKSHPQPRPSTPQEAKTNEAALHDVVQLLFGGRDPQTKQEPVVQQRPTDRLVQPCHRPVLVSTSTVKPKDISPASSSTQRPQAKAQQQIPAQQAPSPSTEASTTLDFLNILFGAGQPTSKATEATRPSSSKVAPISQPTATVTPPKRAESPSASLKEQLEARLANDESSEIRDTIQAIFASLADAAHSHAPQGLSASASNPGGLQPQAESASKGKGKAQVPLVIEPSSKDVLKSMETIHSIDAAFSALQEEFVFPSQLDFTPTSSTTSSPVSSDNESTTSTITKLPYTSKNHPIRYYEQNLSGLLTQLDGVESFGNAEVRTVRKEVVARVEGALDELEREVEGRWRIRVAKATKAKEESVKPVETEAVEADTPAADHSLPSDTTSVASPIAASVEEQPATLSPGVSSADDQITTTLAESESENALVANKTVLPVPTVPEEKQTSSDSTTTDGSANDLVEAQSQVDPEPSPVSVSAETEDKVMASEERDIAGIDLQDPLSLSISFPTSSYPPIATSTSSSAAASVATLRPYDVASTSSEEEEDVKDVESDLDEFLLSGAPRNEEKGKQDAQEDVGSDWSEVEA